MWNTQYLILLWNAKRLIACISIRFLAGTPLHACSVEARGGNIKKLWLAEMTVASETEANRLFSELHGIDSSTPFCFFFWREELCKIFL
jgi:hypothetical protein